MDCQDIDELLTAYLEGQTTPVEAEGIRRHLAGCARCRDELAALGASRDKLRRLLKAEASRVEPSPGGWEAVAVRAGIKEGEQKPVVERLGKAWMAAPVCIFLLAVLAGFASMFGGGALPPPEPPTLVGDGQGGAILVWLDVAGETDSIRAQRLDAEGNLLWGQDGIQVVDEEDHITKATGDGAGGAVVYWMYDGVSYAQRISRDGETLWADGGIPEEDVPQELAAIAPDSSRELKYNVREISVSGQLVTIYIDPPFKTLSFSRVIDDGSGGVIVATRVGEGSSISRTYSVYAQRIDAGGNRLWGDGGLEIQWVASSPILWLMAAATILVTALVIAGVYRRNRLARVLTAVMPAIISIAAVSSLFFNFLLGYSSFWADIPDTPGNKIATCIMPVAAVIMVMVGDRHRTVSRWILVPVLMFCLLVAAIVIFWSLG